MKKSFLTSAFLFSLLTNTSSHAAIDDNAEVVLLKQSCAVNGSLLDNCFSSYSDLKNWTETIRRPNANSPLLVNIGPGTFGGTPAMDINISCQPGSGYTGHTSFMGSGSNQTILKGTGSGQSSSINVTNCTDLNFSNLRIETNFYGGIYWSGGGKSRWIDVEVKTNGRAWFEPVCGSERGQHYWYSSKIDTSAVFSVAMAYRADCDETWFFGSEVKITVPESQSGNNSGGAVSANNNGIIHLYGSNLRSFLNGGGNPNATFNIVPAASASNGGEVHIHGTGIDVISETGRDVVALDLSNGGFIHADVSAYVMKTTGNKTRIRNNGGTVKAPYQWTQSDQPPQVDSETGADIAVETNCDASGCHDINTGIETHLLIYNNNCDVAGHGPWFDVVTGKCRGDMSMN